MVPLEVVHWNDPASQVDDPPCAHMSVPVPIGSHIFVPAHHGATHMSRIIYHLANCTTCQRILKQIPKLKTFTLREIKTEPITAQELDAMKKLAGSHEALFSRVALKYRELGLNKMTLTEKDYRRYILDEYTFLKRPVMIVGDRIFIGNAPKTVAARVEAAKG
jgi:arsenate reductase